MVLSFFRKGESGMGHITAEIVSILGDARHSFDVATGAVLGGDSSAHVAADIASTDERINRTEHALRRELIVHVSVQGTADIGQVLGYTLLIKKVERIGDQAKNIFELATEGVSLAGADDVDEYVSAQQTISAMFATVAALLLEPDEEAIAEFRAQAEAQRNLHDARIRELLHSEEPGHHAVPRAILHRYLKRIAANLAGIASTVTEPIPIAEDTDRPR
jgi:phosphate uptake regulator